jgi:hypothetical protein
MAIETSTGLAGALLGQLNTTFASKTCEIRTGSPPSSPDSAQTGTVLVTITLPATPFSVSGRTASKAGTWSDSSADATGTAGYFLIYDTADGTGASTAHERITGTVTATGGGGDMTLDNTSITAGQSVTINTVSLTIAES